MIKIEFTEEEIKELYREHLHNSHPLVRKRCEVVYLKALGYSHQEIGHIVRISQPTLRGYLRTYQEGGLEKLKELNFYRPSSELDEYRDMRDSATSRSSGVTSTYGGGLSHTQYI